MKKSGNKRGFTLIELLISMTILIAITFITAFKYINVVEENNTKVDIINAKTIADGIKIASLSGVQINKDGGNINSPADLSNYFDTEIKPKSKTYGSGEDSSFTYQVKENTIIIMAGGKQVYPIDDTNKN